MKLRNLRCPVYVPCPIACALSATVPKDTALGFSSHILSSTALPKMPGEVTSLSSTWSATGKFNGEPYLTSLRGKDPKRTSTVTMHVAKEHGPAPTGVAGVRSHHFGPGVKVVGGQVMYAYEERTGGSIKVGKSPDPLEILREYLRPARPTTAPDTEPATISQAKRAAGRPSTSYEPRSRPNGPPVAKVVYWDGMRHHVMEKPEATSGSGQEDGAWQPPHLEHRDIEPGLLLGVRETGGAAGTALIGSKHRAMLDRGTASTTWPDTNLQRSRHAPFGPVAPPYGANKGPYGLKPYAPIEATTSFGMNGNINEGTLRSYANFKLVGHKEYERTCRSLQGIQAWTAAEGDVTTSMSHGHSTRLLAPKEHIVTKLSLRRGGF